MSLKYVHRQVFSHREATAGSSPDSSGYVVSKCIWISSGLLITPRSKNAYEHPKNEMIKATVEYRRRNRLC